MTPSETTGTIHNGTVPRPGAHLSRIGPRANPLIRTAPENRMPIDEARRLPRFRSPTWQTPAPLIEADAPRDWRPSMPSSNATWSPEDLRGIPIIGRSVAGAIPGSNPLAEAMRKDAAA